MWKQWTFCADVQKHRILTTEVTFTPLKSQRRQITDREKKIEKGKFNVTERDYRVLHEKGLFFAELPFSGLKTLNSIMRS